MANTRIVAITIDSAEVAGDVTNFPMLLKRGNLPDEICDPSGDSARTDGGDLRFYSDEAGTTELAREIVSFEHDTSTGSADAAVEIWVKVASISGSSDTTIYCQYGDGSLTEPSAGSTYGSQAVWSDYISVHHCSDTSDSTGNGHTLSLTGSPSVSSAGLTSGAYSLDGSSQYLNISHDTDFNLNRDYTIQILLRSDAADTSQGASGIIDKSLSNGNGYKLIWTTSTGWRMRHPNLSSSNLNGADSFSANADLFMASTMDGTTRRIYKDGVSISSDTPSGSVTNNTNDVTIGYHQAFTSEKWNGLVDEIRFKDSDLSANWLTTEYNNVGSPETFCTAGTPEAIGGGPTYTLESDAGSLSLSGVAAGLSAGRYIGGSAGAYSLAGVSADLSYGRQMSAGAGSYSLTGVSSDFNRGYALSAAAGSFSLSGQPSGLLASRKITGGLGTYTLTGVAANLTYTPAGGYIIQAGVGAFTLTGVSSDLPVSRKIAAGVGSYALTGLAADVLRQYSLVCGVGSYTLTGQSASFPLSRKLSGATGIYALTGVAADLDYSNEAVWTTQSRDSTSWDNQSSETTTWTVQ